MSGETEWRASPLLLQRQTYKKCIYVRIDKSISELLEAFVVVFAYCHIWENIFHHDILNAEIEVLTNYYE